MATEMSADEVVYRHCGYCPICERASEFIARFAWYRDHLICRGCDSIPRERALALVLSRHYPRWRTLAIHESSPVARGISLKMSRECVRHVASQFYPDKRTGTDVRGFRNENLEAQSFADATFDLVVTLDVMEHVNRPDRVVQEISRTLRPGGAYLFTTPTYAGKETSERRALYESDGTVEYLAEAEYHGNPVSSKGALVTFHFGHDLPKLIQEWSGMDVETVRFQDHHHGIIGEFTDVYVARRVSGGLTGAS